MPAAGRRTVGAAPRTGTCADNDTAAALGRAIRARRRERGMTLVQLAAAAGLSQPFLSQLELGRSRPSMRSLFRIATALGTTQQTLLGDTAGDRIGEPVRGPVRGGGEALLDVDGGGARLLLHDPGGADVTEFVDVPAVYGDFFAHARQELLYVARGRIEVELREDGTSRFEELGARDTLAYAGSVAHRFRRLGAAACVVLVVHSGA